MAEIWQKYSADDLILEAETVEEYGEYMHLSLMQYSPEQLRDFGERKRQNE